MSFGLPEGLVTANSSIAGELERLDRIAVEDVIQLWKGSSCNVELADKDLSELMFYSLLYQQSHSSWWSRSTTG